MITRAELGRAAATMGLGLGQAEHEYAILCALDGLSQTALLRDTFCLKGGTALRQLYYPDWRHSVDLDFSVLPAFPFNGLRDGLTRWFATTDAQHGAGLAGVRSQAQWCSESPSPIRWAAAAPQSVAGRSDLR